MTGAAGPSPSATAGDALEGLLARALALGLRAVPWRASLALGAALGDALRALGVRRDTARENLAHAFPGATAAWRDRVLTESYRELGRVAAEYVRLGDLVSRPAGEVVAAVRGMEHLLAAREAGRGAILMSGHFGNFELVGAYLGKAHGVDFVVRPLKNPAVEALLGRERARAGVGRLSADSGVRRVYESLRANRWVAMLADQDARRHGAFVPFLGRPASTALGPARIALATGAPIIMGFTARRPDGRHELTVEAPLEIPDPGAPDAALRLTALHVARLEARVRERPEMWLWLHRRWKTTPPAGVERRGTEREPARPAGAHQAGSA